ncbi:sugar ABC transporter permease [Microbacterium sp. HM58-2]|nr:sugar ABC transporter permease [Microbacterium sp. HM58-2]
MTKTRAERRHRFGRSLPEGLTALLFAAPVILVFGLFAWSPIVQSAVLAFQKTNLVSPAAWVGWGNFAYVMSDPLLPQAVMNTVWFATLALVIGFPIPLVLAVLISELRRSRALFAVLAYMPVVIPPVVAILLWRFFYDPSAQGLFNRMLGAVGVPAQPWLNGELSAMPSIVVEVTWATAGGTVIIYLAALSSIRSDLYEAAELDRAGVWRRLWHVTLPQLRGVILVTLLLQIIGTLQVFTEPFLFTGGGPKNATVTILMMVYDYAFVNGDFGAATALSVMLAIVLAALSALYLLATRRWSTR